MAEVGLFRRNVDIKLNDNPIKKHGKVLSVLSAQARADIFKNILDINTFNGTAFSSLIRSDGDYVLRANHPSIDNFQNFFDQPETFLTIKKDKLKSDISELKNGTFWTYLDIIFKTTMRTRFSIT